MTVKLSKTTLFFWFLIIFVYLVTRVVNLKIIPIFTDEAIYSYWAQVALNDPQHRYISLEDGKQPLFIWLAAIAQKIVQDPLVASRIVSVIAGLGSVLGIFLVAKNLFNEHIAKIASVLYVVMPFTLLYDRLAIYDSLLTMLGIYAIYFSIKMATNPSLGLAQLGGYAIGLATITKSSGIFFLYLLPFSLLTSNKQFIRKNFLTWIGLSLVTLLVSQAIYNSLRLSPLFYIIARKNMEFIRSPMEVLKDPFAHFGSNFTSIISWLFTYLSPPLFLLFLVSIIIIIYKKNLKGLYLLVLIVAPFTAELLFNKVLYTRFVLFYFPYILILIAFCIYNIHTKIRINVKLKYLLFIALLIIPSITSIQLITNPTSAKIPKSDSDQYLNSWPAGYGVEQVVNTLKSESATKTINVGTEGTFGLMPYALNIYFYQNPNINVHSFWPLNPEDLPLQLLEYSKSNKTYLIVYQTQLPIKNPKLKLVNSYRQGVGNSYLRLYEVVR